jgi:nitroreductase
MDLRELIRSRRTVGVYKKDLVDDAVVREALELSLWAPNHKLTFPWVYTLIGPVVRGALADLAVELKGEMTAVKAQAVRESVLNPSHLIALGRRRSGDANREHEDYATLACSVQIASMYLWERGVSSKWTTSGWSRHARTYEWLGLRSEDVALEGVLMVGMASVVPRAPARPALELRTTK